MCVCKQCGKTFESVGVGIHLQIQVFHWFDRLFKEKKEFKQNMSCAHTILTNDKYNVEQFIIQHDSLLDLCHEGLTFLAYPSLHFLSPKINDKTLCHGMRLELLHG